MYGEFALPYIINSEIVIKYYDVTHEVVLTRFYMAAIRHLRVRALDISAHITLEHT